MEHSLSIKSLEARYLSLLFLLMLGMLLLIEVESLHVKTKPGSENGCSSQQRLPLASCSSSWGRKAIPFYKTRKASQSLKVTVYLHAGDPQRKVSFVAQILGK